MSSSGSRTEKEKSGRKKGTPVSASSKRTTPAPTPPSSSSSKREKGEASLQKSSRKVTAEEKSGSRRRTESDDPASKMKKSEAQIAELKEKVARKTKQLQYASTSVVQAEIDKENALFEAKAAKEEAEALQEKVAQLQAQLKKKKNNSMKAVKDKWFYINDEELQVALPKSAAFELEEAFNAKKWFTEVDTDQAKSKTYVKLFSDDDARMFVRDDKEDLLGRRVEREKASGKRGSPYPSHFPPVAPVQNDDDEPQGVAAIPAQFRGLFGAGGASASSGGGMAMPPQLAAMMGGNAAPASEAGDVHAELQKEHALRLELEADMTKLKSERMEHMQKLVKDKMQAKSQLAAEKAQAKKLTAKIAELEKRLQEATVTATPRTRFVAETEAPSSSSDDDSSHDDDSDDDDDSASDSPLPPPSDTNNTDQVDALQEQLDACRAELGIMKARLARSRRDSMGFARSPSGVLSPSRLASKHSSLSSGVLGVQRVNEPVAVQLALAEERRLSGDARRVGNWKRWGPYLAERQWGVVREDYSPNGAAWSHLTHDQARSTAYRWGEDGLLGVCDRECRLALSVALWNGNDTILKERLFGLTNAEGNHGEDVKEEYYYIASTPTHSYMKALYKYPFDAFPYEQLVNENVKRDAKQPEFELKDTNVFDDNRYFDVSAEYAKADDNDILLRLTITNRSPTESHVIHVMPQLTFRNTWSWQAMGDAKVPRPSIKKDKKCNRRVKTSKFEGLEPFAFEIAPSSLTPPSTKITSESIDNNEFNDNVESVGLSDVIKGDAEFWFTHNETNKFKRFNEGRERPAKDAFHEALCDGKGEEALLDSARGGTKCGVHSELNIPPNTKVTLRYRLYMASKIEDDDADCDEKERVKRVFSEEQFDDVFAQRILEHNAFYSRKLPATLSTNEKLVAQAAYANLLWNKQFYNYVIEEWLDGDAVKPPESRRKGRNSDWRHFHARDVILMPDTWEYPWFAVWDLAFHAVALAPIDSHMAKSQLLLFLREWYMHPNGCLPAYEWNFFDVNPPVHAWAVWRVYRLDGSRDKAFLARGFQKLLINFTWWVNRKDPDGRSLFSGGFLGLDNIGVFDRSAPLPIGGHLEQADATAWMAAYCVTMLKMALELAHGDASYEDLASKFFEHFVEIADAMNKFGGTGLWDEKDGFYYDVLRNVNSTDTIVEGESPPEIKKKKKKSKRGASDDKRTESTGSTTSVSPSGVLPLRIRSLVGIVPLFATGSIPSESLSDLKGFQKRTKWFLDNKKDLAEQISLLSLHPDHVADHSETDVFSDDHHLLLLSVPNKARVQSVLKYIADESEFLSPFGVRSLSLAYADTPYTLEINGQSHVVEYAAAESTNRMFGGNSNWRGPIWMPTNFLLIESLERLHHFYGDSLKVEYPNNSGNERTLEYIANDICARISSLFLPQDDKSRPVHGNDERYLHSDRSNLLLFYEYFNAETGAGCGASHQSWTSLAAACLVKLGANRQRSHLTSPYYYPSATLSMVEGVAADAPLNAYLLRGDTNELVVSYIVDKDNEIVQTLQISAVADPPSNDLDVSSNGATDIDGDGLIRFQLARGNSCRLSSIKRQDNGVLVHRSVAVTDEGFVLAGASTTFATMEHVLLHLADDDHIDISAIIKLNGVNSGKSARKTPSKPKKR